MVTVLRSDFSYWHLPTKGMCVNKVNMRMDLKLNYWMGNKIKPSLWVSELVWDYDKVNMYKHMYTDNIFRKPQ